MADVIYHLIRDGWRWVISAERHGCCRWLRHPSGRVRYWLSEARAKTALAALAAQEEGE